MSASIGDKLEEAYTFLHLAIHEKSGEEREDILLDGLASLQEVMQIMQKMKRELIYETDPRLDPNFESSEGETHEH